MSGAATIWRLLEITHTSSWLLERLHRFPTILGWIAPATITNPVSGDLVDTPITIRGRHNNPKGNFWLVTNYKNDYWPKSKLHLQPDHRWETKIYTGADVTATILLVRVSDLQEKLFDVWMQNAEHNNWKPLSLPPAVTNLMTISSIVVNVKPK
jgi:hypothetical protein